MVDPVAGGSAKGQAGLSPELTKEFGTTGLNPVLLDSTGTYLIMHNIPSLPQIPASPQLLKALWPRLQSYAVTDKDDPLASVCEAGAGGDEKAAVRCMETWHERIPALQVRSHGDGRPLPLCAAVCLCLRLCVCACRLSLPPLSATAAWV